MLLLTNYSRKFSVHMDVFRIWIIKGLQHLAVKLKLYTGAEDKAVG